MLLARLDSQVGQDGRCSSFLQFSVVFFLHITLEEPLRLKKDISAVYSSDELLHLLKRIYERFVALKLKKKHHYTIHV